MALVKFTSNLKRFFPDLKSEDVPGDNLSEIIQEIEIRYEGIRSYLLTDTGEVRTHVNVYINDTLIHDRARLTDKVEEADKVLFMQAISGG